MFAEMGHLEKVIVKVLAVGGGFLLGHVGTRLLLGVLGKGVREALPQWSVALARFCGGVAAAVLVYFLLSGNGGLGLGGSGGGQAGDPGGNAKGNGTVVSPEPKKDVKKDPDPPVIVDPVVRKEEQILVRVVPNKQLADPADERFFLFNDDTSRHTADQIVVLAKLLKAKNNVGVVVITSDPDASAPAGDRLKKLLVEQAFVVDLR